MGLWEQGSDNGFPGFGMGMSLADLQAVEKYQNIRMWLKRRVRWARTLRDRCHNITAEVQSFPGADMVLRDKRRSSAGLVRLISSGWGGEGCYLCFSYL
jgi:hypothetical protein